MAILEYNLIISGNEILSGKRSDRHVFFLSRALERIGLACRLCVFVGDNPADLTEHITTAMRRVPLVILTGGLGPTVADVTRPALSAATGIPLEENAQVLEAIRARFQRMGRELKENNSRQALVPTSGTYFPNDHGTAPGLVFDVGDTLLVALPGPPHELKPMVEEYMIPFLQSRFPNAPRLVAHTFCICGLGESNIESLVQEKLGSEAGLTFSYIATLGIVELTLLLPPAPKSENRMKTYTQQVRDLLGDNIYSEENETLEDAVGRLLQTREETLSIAESCTGGMLGSFLTNVPGASQYFLGGVIAYSNALKESVLSVSKEILSNHGAVSPETVCEMARGACARFGSTWSIAVTGIAGPAGGSPDKPAGTVWIAVAHCTGRVYPLQIGMPGDRDTVRRRCVVTALDQLRRLLSGLAPYESRAPHP